ncbi:MAG: amidohydrolase, partial [Eudoraea sp.]|nr:amidohydrolase [Eudoraea sp.]
MRLKFLVAALICSATAFAQDYFPDNDGVKSKNTNYTAFTNAKIHVSPTQVIQNGTLLIKEGKVVQAGSAVQIPANSILIDVSGKSIYPSFIDPFSNFGVEKPKRAPG